MDPYQVLGVDNNASQEDIKLAYRRVAMKWHPDRNDNSAESREHFHQAAAAYKQLRERAAPKQRTESGSRASSAPPGEDANHSANTGEARDNRADSQEGFADSTFWDAMLDYAIKLAQNDMSQADIAASISRNGCPEKLSRIIAEKAFNINAHYGTGSGKGKNRNPRADQASFKEERQDADLWRAFLGQRSFMLSGRGSGDYYQVVFRELNQSVSGNPLSWINLNKRLMNILSFSIVLFATILVAVHFFPGPSPYKLIGDQDMLQIPFLVLPLMLVWMLYRKLWLASLAFALCYLGTIAYYDAAMPAALKADLYAVLGVAAVCFGPFIFLALFANFLYYLKAQRMMHRARHLFADSLDQMVWIKNRAGTSSAAAFLFVLIFVSSLIHLAPQIWDFSGPARFARAASAKTKVAKLEKIQQHVDEARDFFEVGERHFHSTPPDFVVAEMAYSTATDKGSLLAAYKLGYMYYNGEGAVQNDRLALEYFLQATQAPLAYQPHNLEITTRFLAESYNNLGIMYQGGFGTSRDFRQAEKMFRRAVEFGSSNAVKNLSLLKKFGGRATRKPLSYPDYR